MRALSVSSLSPGLRGSLLGIGFFLLALLVGYESAQYVVSGDFFTLIILALAAGVCAVAVVIMNNWRSGLYIFLAWVLFEDLLRKFLGNNMAIYFGKDVLAAVLYVSFLAAMRRQEVKSFRPPFLFPLIVFLLFGTLQVFNPASTSLIFGVLGMKLYFFYFPLVFIGYALLDSETDLQKFFSFNLLLAGVIGFLGVLQSVLGHTFLNPSMPAEDIRGLSTLYREAPISHALAYRPTSVFVSTGRFGTYMVLAWLITFGFGGYLLLRRRRGRTLAFLALAIVTLGAVMSASRGTILWTAGSALVGGAAFLWGAPWRQREVIRVLRLLQRTLLVAGLALCVSLVAFPEQVGSRFAFYTETLHPDSPTSELIYRTRDYPLKNFLLAFEHPRWLYGYGIGTASLGVQYVARIAHERSPVIGVESGYGALVVELGIGGLILWIIWTAALVFSGWRVVRRLRGSPWFPLAFMIFWYAFLLLFPITYAGLQPYQDFVLNAYLWLLVGILFRLPGIALSAQEAAGRQAPFRMP